MPRGDFRSTAGQVISSGSRQVHSAGFASARYSPQQVQRDPIQAGITQGLDYVSRVLGQQKARADREKEREAERIKRIQQNRAEYERRRTEQERESRVRTLDQALLETEQAKYLRYLQSEVPRVLTENPELVNESADRFLELSGIGLADYSKVKDQTLAEASRMRDLAHIEEMLMQTSAAYDKAQTMESMTVLTDEAAVSNFDNVDELMEIGQSEGLSEQDVWTSLTTSAFTAATDGNVEAVEPLLDKAKEINNPELREAVMRDLMPLVSGVDERTKTRKHIQLLEAQTTIDGVRQMEEAFGDIFSPDRFNSEYARVEKLEGKESLLTRSFSRFAATGFDFDELTESLGQTLEFQGSESGKTHSISLSPKEIEQAVNQKFMELQRDNPAAVPELLAKATKIPTAMTRSMRDMMDTGIVHGTLNTNDKAFVFFKQAIDSVGGNFDPLTSAAQLNYKYGFKDKQAAVVSLALARMDGGSSLEEALTSAFETVQSAGEYEGREMGDYNSALDTMLSGKNYSPRQVKIARESLRANKFAFGVDKAVEEAIAAAEARVTNIGEGWFADGIPVYQGDRFTSDVKPIVGNYPEATTEALLEKAYESYGMSTSQAQAEYNPVYVDGQLDKRQSVIILSTLEDLPKAVSLLELEEIAADSFETYDLTRSNKAESNITATEQVRRPRGY